MSLINTGGLTIIGAGSEWFWAMAGFIAIPITGLMIFSQLRAQRSANRVSALFALRDQWFVDRVRRSALLVLLHHAASKPGWPPTLAHVGGFFERLAIILKRGDVNAEDVWAEVGPTIQLYWQLNAAAVVEERKRYPRLWEHWEVMASTMAEIGRRRGYPHVDLESARAALPDLISDEIEALRLEQEAKAGVVPSWSPSEPAEDGQGIPA